METEAGSVKGFLIVTSILEGSTGLALMTVPSFVINLLLGSPLPDLVSIIITRIAGAAVVSLGLACWFSRKSESVNGLIIALLLYNLAATAFFVYAGMFENLNGIALWPVVALHMAMAAWSAKCLSFTSKLNSKK